MNRRLKIRDGTLEWRTFEEEIVAVDTRKSVYLAVNRSGSVLWPPLLEGTTRSQLIESLIAAFGVAEASASEDVDTFIAALDEQDLLEP